MRSKLRVIGNGMSGARFVEELLRLSNERYDIAMYGREPHPNYNRILLSTLLAGEAQWQDIVLNPLDWYAQNDIRLVTGDAVVRIDREHKRIYTASGAVDEYDVLVIATGSDPAMPAIPGTHLHGVTAFRSIADCETLRTAAAHAQASVVIGGGLLGLEAAYGLISMGVPVTVVHRSDVLMNRQLDAQAATMLQDALGSLGISFRLATETAGLCGTSRVQSVRFSDGSSMPADIVVIATGIRPNVSLAKEAGLQVNRGIVVDDTLQTSDPSVYALGECIEHRDQTYGLVSPVFAQGKVLARVLCDKSPCAYEGSTTSATLKVAGIDMYSMGTLASDASCHMVSVYDERHKRYKKLILRDDRVVGAVLFGDTTDATQVSKWIVEGISIAEQGIPLREYRSDSGQGDDVSLLAEEAILCGCNGVTKGAIAGAVRGGCATLREVRDRTGASRSCGGCSSLVGRLIARMTDNADAETSSPVVPICNCTSLGREEVLAEIRAKHLTHVREVMNVLQWTNPEGCSKCRPALNYYLTMAWPLMHQDEPDSRFVNERLHANIQRDGTYSVVPRIYGGVVTSDQLRKIADVADKYQVPVLKITGGQRIDLLGVKKQDLPQIWSDLGMPSGYAYGKAIRTVKTCVGQTYCRFGTRDSMQLGILLEKKFERLNTPAKVKMGVSACPRNCAESIVKDVGLVSTSAAWEIYVGGNGGVKVRSAELLATVNTEDEVVTWVGAFLQLYREEANYGERTAQWIERVGMDWIGARLDTDAQRGMLMGRLEESLVLLADPWEEIVQEESLRAPFATPVQL